MRAWRIKTGTGHVWTRVFWRREKFEKLLGFARLRNAHRNAGWLGGNGLQRFRSDEPCSLHRPSMVNSLCLAS
jgi:hypothetical protein